MYCYTNGRLWINHKTGNSGTEDEPAERKVEHNPCWAHTAKLKTRGEAAERRREAKKRGWNSNAKKRKSYRGKERGHLCVFWHMTQTGCVCLKPYVCKCEKACICSQRGGDERYSSSTLTGFGLCYVQHCVVLQSIGK